ncbi:MAG: sugar-transfer associated ATP-grasp domain-containing protein [Bacteroidales bacterium]|nr:sugar-transfer associated ATP-grasp domain-containing protein [Bacteroidales bacterium]
MINIKLFIKKTKAIIEFVFNNKEYLKGESYYPNEPRKSKREMFWDQLYFVRKYGNVEKFYYAYGFDRKSMTLEKCINEYIINEKDFLHKVNYNNDHLRWNLKLVPGRVILADKFYFYLFLRDFGVPTPKIYYYFRDGAVFYSLDEENTNGDQGELFNYDLEGFAKPLGGQLGDGAFPIKVSDSRILINNDKEVSEEELLQSISKTNYIIQERIVQHTEMNKLCSTSLNTIRFQTILTEDEGIIAFGAGVRMGREGSYVDNWAKGGVFVGVDMNTGKLLKNGFIKPPFGTVVTQHPDNGLVFEGFEIPCFQEAVNIAKELHSRLYRIHSIGWDVAITENGPVFIEGNSLWEISLIQAAHGGLKKQIEKYFN